MGEAIILTVQPLTGKPVKVAAEVVGATGDYAIHQVSGFGGVPLPLVWSVTHVPSGLACVQGVAREVAMRAAVEFDRVIGVRLRGITSAEQLPPDLKAEGKALRDRFIAEDEALEV